MTKKFALLGVFCLATLILFAQKKQTDPKGLIIFTETTHDYGTIDVGSSGKSEFRFTNHMNTALVISNVKPSCGCTVADWPKEPIPAGKTGIIKLHYNTKIPGTFSKTIMVNSNARNPTVMLRIKGNVVIAQK